MSSPDAFDFEDNFSPFSCPSAPNSVPYLETPFINCIDKSPPHFPGTTRAGTPYLHSTSYFNEVEDNFVTAYKVRQVSVGIYRNGKLKETLSLYQTENGNIYVKEESNDGSFFMRNFHTGVLSVPLMEGGDVNGYEVFYKSYQPFGANFLKIKYFEDFHV